MPELSNAEELFKKIISQPNPAGYLEAMILVSEVETEWLEFKGCERISEKDVDRHWSKALSGFANTAGGVLIWGVDARKNEDGVDCARELSLVPDPEKLAQRLSDVLLNSVAPPLRGIEIKPFKKPGQKEGFVVCLIPEGTAKAYRAEASDRQFYMRMRDTFHIPPAAVIRSLFFPRASAYLVPSIFVKPREDSPDPFQPLQFWFGLKNEGTLTARSISMSIHHPKSLHFGVTMTDRIRGPKRLHEIIAFTPTNTINPDMEERGLICLHIDKTESIREGFPFTIVVSCEDSPVVKWERFLSHYDYLKTQTLPFTLKG